MTNNSPKEKIRKTAFRLAQPDIMFYTLPWLMVLLIAGTIAQKEIGLYQAEKIFFSSWILWLGFVPLPGGLLTLSAIFINLCAKFILKSKWSWRGCGTVLTHFGILLLFIGALFTATTAKEGFILIPEGQSSNKVLDYYKKYFYIFENEEKISSLSFKQLKEGSFLKTDGLPFKIRIISTCENCDFLATPEGTSGRVGLAEKITLQNAPILKEREANLSGVTFQISGTTNQDGTYVSTEAAPHAILIEESDITYRVQFQKAETKLPFTITLKDFERQLHPGTQTPRHFHSDIDIQDNDSSWSTRISMNQPLRYKGYTFFQSSFTDTPAGEATVLAVVKNSGWLFPYISSIIIALGLLIHLIIRMRGQYE